MQSIGCLRYKKKVDLVIFSISYLIQNCFILTVTVFLVCFHVDDEALPKRKANFSLTIGDTFEEAFNNINSPQSQKFIHTLTTKVVSLILLLQTFTNNDNINHINNNEDYNNNTLHRIDYQFKHQYSFITNYCITFTNNITNIHIQYILT